MTAEWGLSELKLENGVLEGDDALKPILHALLISGTLPTLSLAGNKKVRAGGWRLLAVFLKRVSNSRKVHDASSSCMYRRNHYGALTYPTLPGTGKALITSFKP